MPGQSISLLTLNTGLLKVELFGRPLVEPAPYLNERFTALGPALLDSGADIIALQEIYNKKHRDELATQLKPLYPWNASHKGGWFPRLNPGLMFFSKFPITHAREHSFGIASPDEIPFVHKGLLSATFDTDAHGRLHLVNSYNTSGGLLWHPEHPFMDRIRRHQYRQMFRHLEKVPWRNRIALGDFNAGPEASPKNYADLLSYGFVDAWATHHGPATSRPTWDATNPLNTQGPHRNASSQRMDHVLIHPEMFRGLRLADARVVFDTPSVAVGNNKHVTISDHYGLQVRLDAVE